MPSIHPSIQFMLIPAVMRREAGYFLDKPLIFRRAGLICMSK